MRPVELVAVADQPGQAAEDLRHEVAQHRGVGAQRALEAAVELAGRDHAELLGLAIEAHLPHYGATVGEVDEEREVEEQACKALIAEATAVAEAHGVALHGLIRAGHPAQQIVQAAAEAHADLIVVGHRGHSGVWGRFLGSTAEKVSRHAETSVLIVR